MTDAPGPLAAIRAEMRALDVSTGALRRFGLVVGAVLAVAAGLWIWRHGGAWTKLSGGVALVGGTLIVLGAVAPRRLQAFHLGWMTLAFALGWVMTRVILTLAWALVFVPIGLFFKLTGRDVLHRRPDRSVETYWQPRETPAPPRERMERMF